MIDIINGVIKINEQLEISSKYTFKQFQQTKYYKGQDGIRIIYLDEPQNMEGERYMVNLFFREGIIYMVSLLNIEKEFSESDEFKRKEIHDELLKQMGIDTEKQYSWGRVISEYDAKSNISSIDIVFFN